MITISIDISDRNLKKELQSALSANFGKGVNFIDCTPNAILAADILVVDEKADRKMIPSGQKIILITSSARIPVDTVRWNVISLFSPPIDYTSVCRVIEGVARENKHGKKWKFHKNLVPTEDGLLLLDDFEIIRFEAEGNYTLIKMNNQKKLMVAKTLKYFESNISFNFFRVHHKHIINLNYITKIMLRKNCYLMLQNEEVIPVSVRRKDYLIKYLTGQTN